MAQNMSHPKNPPIPPSPLSRAIIVAWVMCTLTALLGELSILVLLLFGSFIEPSERVAALGSLLVLAATFSGIFGLIILPFALRSAGNIIPRRAIIVAVVICLLPLLGLIALLPGTSGS